MGKDNNKIKKILFTVFSTLHELVIIKEKKTNKVVLNTFDLPDNYFIEINDEMFYKKKWYSIDKKEVVYHFNKYEIYLFHDISVYKNKIFESNIDHLTGLYNLRIAHQEMEQLKEQNKEFYVIIGDVDNFKKINDTIGHIEANTVLKEIANTIKKTISKNDIPIRFGGEEFLIITTLDNDQKAIKLAEKIRENISNSVFKCYYKKVTISFGLCKCNNQTEIEEALLLADSALYESKRKGKNRVTYKK